MQALASQPIMILVEAERLVEDAEQDLVSVAVTVGSL